MEEINIKEYKNKLIEMLPTVGASPIIEDLKQRLPNGSNSHKIIVQIEMRLKGAMQDNWNGVVSREQFELSRNKINESLIHIISNLSQSDFSTNGTESLFGEIASKVESNDGSSLIRKLAIVGLSGFALWYAPLGVIILVGVLFPDFYKEAEESIGLASIPILYLIAIIIWGVIITKTFSSKSRE